MTEARLASAMLVGALRQLAEREGGFATVLAQGDQVAGTLLVEVVERGGFWGLFERMPTVTGTAQWIRSTVDAESRDAYLERRRRNDPDLWLIELDVPDAPRFIPLLPLGT